jgi:hypothetical protein
VSAGGYGLRGKRGGDKVSGGSDALPGPDHAVSDCGDEVSADPDQVPAQGDPLRG